LEKLKLSSDRKVSPKSIHSNSGWKPDIPNSFGLPAHVSCPGKTTVCEKICYAYTTERRFTSTNKLVMHNWDVLQKVKTSTNKMVSLLDDAVNDYLVAHAKAEKRRGSTYEKVFRIHWDGDFFSVNYAKAWRQVILKHPEIQFWVYTRSFIGRVNVIPVLADIPNLSLYLSVDDDNMDAAERIIRDYPNVLVAALGKTFESATETAVKVTKRRAPKCPEQTGRFGLVLDNGVGACVHCALCVNGTNNVLFSISRK
jgi:hypothetical protein